MRDLQSAIIDENNNNAIRTSLCDRWDLEGICEHIEEGTSITEIARSLGITHSALVQWLNHPNRSARASRAKDKSAEGWMDRGLAELMNIPDNGTQAQITRAREIAQHCRRMAAIRNPRQYGERLDVSHSGNLNLTALSDQELMRIAQEQSGGQILIENTPSD